MSSAVVEAMARYSASALDRATVGCFLALQEIHVLPRNVHKPIVERRVEGHPTQSESEKAKRVGEPDENI